MSRLNLPQEPLQPFNVLAFDPGGTTGWAWAYLANDSLGHPTLIKPSDIKIQTGEYGPQTHHLKLYQDICSMGRNYMAMDLPALEVVSEPFHYRQNVVGENAAGFRGKVELVSAEYIGVIKLACAQLGLSYYDRFTPGEAKRYVTNTKLEALGWLQTPQHAMRHRNDALRQLVKYLIVKKRVKHPITTAWREELNRNASSNH